MDSATGESRKIVVYLVRHAESLCNVSMGWEERHDPSVTELTPLGKKQAVRLGEHLTDVKFTCAHSSDYTRALDTAKIILKCQAKEAELQPEIQISKELREIGLGKMSNSSYVDILKQYMKSNTSLHDWVLPEGESMHDAGKRMLDHFEQACVTLLESNEDSFKKPKVNLLIVSHSMAILAFLGFLTHDKTHSHVMLNWNGDEDIKIIKNCCYYKFEVSKAAVENDNETSRVHVVPPLQINVVGKYVSSHLSQNSEDEEVLNVSTWDRCYSHGDANKIRKTMELSEKGREVINCVQQ